MEEHTLKGEYISVLKDGRLSYGGSQRWSDSPVLRGYGCGVIAALDLLLYLARQREVGSARTMPAGGPVPWTLYDRWARQLSRRYMPLLRRFPDPRPFRGAASPGGGPPRRR